MHRILVLDLDHPLREQLAAELRRTTNTEVVLASDVDELVSNVTGGAYAAVFADGDLLGANTSRVIGAVRSAVTRPMLIIASNDRAGDLDPDFVSLVVRKPYDVLTLTGILLSAVTQPPVRTLGDDDSPEVG